MMSDYRFTIEGLKETVARLLRENDELRIKIRVYEENVGKIALKPRGYNEQKD